MKKAVTAVLGCCLLFLSSCMPTQKPKYSDWEKSVVTNAVYRLAGSDIYSDSQRKSIANSIISSVKPNTADFSVVDVLENHPELYGEWHEDDIKKYQNINQKNYQRAKQIVDQIMG